MKFFRKSKRVVGFLLSVVLTNACATGRSGPKAGPPVSKSVIIGQTRVPTTGPKPLVNETALRQKMRRFQAVLGHGVPLSSKDWKLHDELLSAYIQLKNLKDQNFAANRMSVPAHGRIKLGLPSFCLNPSRVSPSDSELFIWRKADPKIPYYREIFQFVTSHSKGASREEIQTLLWNLQNETRWENYPDHLKAILQKIDPHAATKLPSKLKDTLKSTAADLITSHLPFGSDARDAIDLVKGDYYRFEDVRRSIEQMKSNYPLEPSDALASIPDSPLYAETESQGFFNQTVTFYNPSNQPTMIDLTDYYLEPKRKDVQRIGLITPPSDSSSGLPADLEKLLYGDMARLGIGFTPGINDVADLYELTLGKDFVSQEKLTPGSRILSGIGLIAGSGAGYRYALRIAHSPVQYLPEFEKGLSKVAKREIELTELGQREVARLADETNQTVSKLEKSPTLERIYKDPQFKSTDFYIRPDGAVIPAKGYRYISSSADYIEDLKSTGFIPASDAGTYVSFAKFESMVEAKSKLQLPHDGRYRLDFETVQVAEDLRTPYGNWGKSDWLEPITKDFPEYGSGGAIQGITNRSIQATKITDLKSGQVLFRRAQK